MKINKLSKSDCLKIYACVKSLRFLSVEKKSVIETMINDDFYERRSPYSVKVFPRTIKLYYRGDEVLDFSSKNWRNKIKDLPDDVCEVTENEKAVEKEV